MTQMVEEQGNSKKNRVIVAAVLVAIACAIGGFGLGYALGPRTTATVNQWTQRVEVSNVTFTCEPSAQPPYLQGALEFNISSTYWSPVLAEVAYIGDWTGDTDQTVGANGTKHVVVTWGPSMDQDIRVSACPNVTVRIWRITQTLEACPNPPC